MKTKTQIIREHIINSANNLTTDSTRESLQLLEELEKEVFELRKQNMIYYWRFGDAENIRPITINEVIKDMRDALS